MSKMFTMTAEQAAAYGERERVREIDMAFEAAADPCDDNEQLQVVVNEWLIVQGIDVATLGDLVKMQEVSCRNALIEVGVTPERARQIAQNINLYKM